MVVLAEEFHGLTLKRKGADEPALFNATGDDDVSGFPISCRANKMRRLACPDPAGGSHHQDAPAWSVAATGQDDVPMCDDAPAPSGYGGEEEGALVLYGRGSGRSEAPRLAVRDGAAGWVRAMLREADRRTVRELLAGAAMEHGSEGLALALVPWLPPSAAGQEAEPSTAAEEAGDDEEGAAAMDVEEDEVPAGHWTGQAAYGNSGADGLVYLWPQHCMAPPQMPPAPQPSPVMWSW